MHCISKVLSLFAALIIWQHVELVIRLDIPLTLSQAFNQTDKQAVIC